MAIRSLVASFLAASLLCGGLAAPAGAEFPPNHPAPDFTLRRLDGRPLSLASLRGKVVLLDFWGPS